MKNIHPKTGYAAVALLFWTAVCIGLSQYAPHFAPNAALTSAVATFIGSVASYFGPNPAPDLPPPAGRPSGT